MNKQRKLVFIFEYIYLNSLENPFKSSVKTLLISLVYPIMKLLEVEESIKKWIN